MEHCWNKSAQWVNNPIITNTSNKQIIQSLQNTYGRKCTGIVYILCLGSLNQFKSKTANIQYCLLFCDYKFYIDFLDKRILHKLYLEDYFPLRFSWKQVSCKSLSKWVKFLNGNLHLRSTKKAVGYAIYSEQSINTF